MGTRETLTGKVPLLARPVAKSVTNLSDPRQFRRYLSGDRAALKQPNHHDYKRENEQHMNEPTHRVRGEEAECPQNT